MTKSFRPLLARAARPDEAHRWPMLASPKLDGVRCLIIDGVPTSRSLKPLPNRALAEFLPWRELEGLDGELILGDPTAPDAYNRTTSAVMSHDGDLTGLRFHVFDHFGEPDEPYMIRRNIAKSAVYHVVSCAWFGAELSVDLLPESEIRGPDQLLEYERLCVEAGYEGVMLRDPMAAYKFGRTASKGAELLKIKRFEDSEAEIIEAHPLMRNGNEQERNELGLAKRSSAQSGLIAQDTLGALHVRDVKTATRDSLWRVRALLPGRYVKYKYQAAGVKEAPRFPVFLGMRSEIDL